MKRRNRHHASASQGRNLFTRNAARASSRKPRALRIESLEQRELLAAPQLIGINPNNGEVLIADAIRHVAPQELTFRFDENQTINPATLGGIQIVRSGFDGVIGNGNDVAVGLGFVGIGERPNEVVVRFAGDLPDDKYRITIAGAGANALRNTAGEAFNNGANYSLNFELDLGAQVVAVVPQPVSRGAGNVLTQARNQIEVYFNNDDLHPTAVQTGQLAVNPTVVDPRFYQLIFTADSVTNTDDQIFLPTSVSYDPATDKAVLTFASDLAALPAGPGTYRLRIGTDAGLPAPPITIATGQDAGASLGSATSVDFTSGHVIVQSAIEPQDFALLFPGANDEPGHRNIPVQDHLLGGGDTGAGIDTIYYNFQSLYGADPLGNPLYNVITSAQKDLARRIFEIYHYYLGVQFVETDNLGLTIVTGDLRALDPAAQTGPGGIAGMAGGGLAIMDNAEVWSDTFGGDWFSVAFHEIGHLLGYGHTYEQPVLTVMGDDATIGGNGEAVYPGDVDILHGQFLHRPDGVDIDLYTFDVTQTGVLTAETIAERLASSSLLDTVISLYRRNGDTLELISRNDDYFSEDSYLEMLLTPGQYAIGVTSSGNRNFDVNVADTGLFGTSDGAYQLRLDLRPTTSRVLLDATGTALDGDGDGVAGGDYNFWFRAQTAARTKFVDKSAVGGVTADGSLSKPYRTIVEAFAAAQYGDIVRLVSNGGSDGNAATVADNFAFKVGYDELNKPLEDGASVKVPRGVTLMIDAGVVVKARSGAFEVGSTAPGVDRSAGALQVLGTPVMPVYFTSYNDETIGRDTNPSVPQTPNAGDWGGILFRNDLDRAATSRLDYEARGIFLNYVNHADMRYGGGRVTIDSYNQVVSPIALVDARATITHNTITRSADAAVSATPNSFEETTFHAPQYQTVAFTSDYSRIGPEIHANALFNNTINGLFIRVRTPAGDALRPLTVAGRFNDTDIVHVLAENLLVQGTPGGPQLDAKTGQPKARLDARLRVDPGLVVKLSQALIQVDVGAQFIAEGVDGRDAIFTSLFDDTYGAGGNFDTSGDGATTTPAAGDWGGLYFGHVSTASVDHARIRYGGGIAKVGSSFAGFNPIEIHQADVRIAHSILEFNALGMGGQAPGDRFGRFTHAAGTIFVRGAQPVIIDNIIRHNTGPAININVNSLNDTLVSDFGRSTGAADLLDAIAGDNFGPLVRGNRLLDNSLNGMLVRGDILTTKSVWDDTSIVHILQSEVIVPDFHSEGGLLLKSSPRQSLVVKLSGATAGFTAAGRQLDIVDRIGGTVQIIGQPGAPVVLTSLADDSVGAGVTPDNTPLMDTNNNGNATTPQPGDWRSVRFAEYCNDRNVALYTERELVVHTAAGANGTPDNAEYIGALAPEEKAGDDNLRLGFQVMGVLSQPNDVDVYSLIASAGTEIWIDIEGTSQALDTIIELVDRNGVVFARSDNSYDESIDSTLLYGAALPMQKLPPFGGRDFFALNPKDAGLRLVLPDSAGTSNLYHLRIRSRGSDINQLDGGQSAGAYSVQVRLREIDELAGSTVTFADIRYATNGIEVFGQPMHSPLTGEATEDGTANETFADAQYAGNMLISDRAALAIAGFLALGDIDFYRFDIQYGSLQGADGDANSLAPAYAGTIFDIDYADGMARGNIALSVFDAQGNLVLIAGDADIRDDRPIADDNDIDDLSRGTVGPLDSFLGDVDLPQGTYYVAVTAVSQMARQLNQYSQRNATNSRLRLEPVDSVLRIAEDHIGSSGGSTAAQPVVPVLIDDSRVVPYTLSDMVLFVSQTDPTAIDRSQLLAINPFTGVIEVLYGGYGRDVGDIALRPSGDYDGDLLAFTLDIQDGNSQDSESGNLIEINPGTGAYTTIGDDGLITYQYSNATPPAQILAGGGGTPDGAGVQFEAMTFGTIANQMRLLGVGYRGDLNTNPRGVSIVRNILYRFDPTTGAILTADTNPNNVELGTPPGVDGAGTNALERGELYTQPTITAAAGGLIADGTVFSIDDGLTTTLFEFDSGPAATIAITPPNQRIQDGESFMIDGYTIEFDTGGVIVITGGGGGITDAVTVTIQDDQGTTVDFEFDKDGAVAGGAVAVTVTNAMNNGQVVAALVAAINGAPNFAATAANIGGRVSIANDFAVTGPATGSVTVVGAAGGTAGNTLVTVEENFTAAQVAAAVAAQVTAANLTASVPGVAATITASAGVTANGTVIVNFNGATTADFTGVNDFTAVPGAVGGSAVPGAVVIPYLVGDLPAQIATRIETAINTALTATVIASASGGSVALLGVIDAPRVVASAPLTAVGEGPGGRITGMTILNGVTYAVSDRGGLWRIDDPLSRAPDAVYIDTSAADLVGIEFAGLTNGPASTSGGLYADMLFGISKQGVLYAFNTAGVLQPVFVDAQTSVELFVDGGVTNLNDIQGLAFSSLDANMWNITGRRGLEAGHGIESSVTHGRASQTGGSSFYFGRGAANYDTPGGAHGAIISNSFDLAAYSTADQPTLYFNYLLSTEEANNLGIPSSMRDSFRVYISHGDSGQWQLLATNNSARVGEFGAGAGVVVQELFDYTTAPIWRQARVNLGAFAGQSDLRLRFEFATAGSYDLGDIYTAGSELRAVPGAAIRDGDLFVINDPVDGDVTFEFDSGYTVVLPSGASITDGDTISVVGPGGLAIFEYDNDATVGQSIAVPAAALLLDGQTFSVSDGVTTLTFEFDDPLGLAPGVQTGNVAIVFDPLSAVSGAQMAATIAQAINGSGMLATAPVTTAGSLLRLDGTGLTLDVGASVLQVVANVALPFSATDTPTGLGSQLAAAVTAANLGVTPHINTLDGGRVNLEYATRVGVNAADLIVEGEVGVFGYTAVLPGGGSIVDGETVTVIGPRGTATFEYDNDGLVGQSIAVPAAALLSDGQTFSVSDGATTLTFEFDDPLGLTPGVQAGNVAIAFDPLSAADGAQMAATIAQAINLAGLVATAPVTTAGPLLRLDGTGLTLDVGAGPLQVVANVALTFSGTETAVDLGSQLAAAVAAADLGVAPSIDPLDGSRVKLENATLVTATATGIVVEAPLRSNGVLIKVHEAMTRQEVATSMRDVIASIFAGYNSQIVMPDGSALVEGDTITVSNGTQSVVIELDSGFVVDVPATGVNDGDTVTVSDGTTTVTFEFDDPLGATPGVAAGNLAVNYVTGASQGQLGAALASAIAAAGVGLDTAQHVGNGRVHLGGTAAHTVTATGAPTVSGLPGLQTVGALSMPFVPGKVFTGDMAATALADLINNAAIGVQATVDGRRVNLLGGDATALLAGTSTVVINATPIQIVSQFDDVLRIVGHSVTDPGKLLLSDTAFGDQFGVYNSPLRAQANNFEGVYIDDLIIGFAERGEMATGTTVDTTFAANPDAPANQILTGAYQLEIRRGPEYGTPIPPVTDQWFVPTRTWDTNDRLAQVLSLTAPNGASIYSGQSFTLGNGIHQVAFVFQDMNAAPGETGNTLATAAGIGLLPSSVGTFAADGAIEDPLDVDLFAISLNAGDTINVDIDAGLAGAMVDSYLRIFNAVGDELAFDDDSAAPDEATGRYSYLSFTAATSGTYYIGVSGYGNDDYDANTAGSGSASLYTGTYRIEIELNGGGDATPTVIIPYQTSDTAVQMAARMVAAINSPETRAVLDIYASGHANGNRIDLSGNATVGGATANTSTIVDDTLIQAIDSGITPNGPGIFSNDGVVSGPTTAGAGGDVDFIRFELAAGEMVAIDIDADSAGSPLDAMLRLFDANGVELAWSDDDPAPGEASNLDAYLAYTATTAGVYYVGISGYDNDAYDPFVAGSGTAGSTGSYRVIITRGTATYADIGVVVSNDFGDQNRFRDQGQLLLTSNYITHALEYGIVSDAGQRTTPDGSPHEGPVRVLWKVNDNGLVPGTTIANNVIAFSGQGGIHFSGDVTPANGQPAPLPYGRILNNTIYGDSVANATIGINVDNNASPTILNNILASLGTGLQVDASSRTTVMAGLLFQDNSVANSNAGLGDHAIVLATGDPLFVNAANGNFYLAQNSKAIDSAVRSLEDRNLLVQIREPLGIANAPVLAPDTDVTGSLRGDDPSVKTPAGLGETVFIDRGAIDRIDFDGPLALLSAPSDGDGDTFALTQQVLHEIVIQLNDGGTGVDDLSVNGGKVTFRREGVTLVDGVDYTFRYDSTNDQIILTAGAGVFQAGHYYIRLDNGALTGIRDEANNVLQANRLNGAVEFDIEFGLGVDWGDAPDPSYPTLQPAGASHAIVSGFYLGYGVDAETNGDPSNSAGADAFDDGVTFVGAVRAVGQSTVIVRASVPTGTTAYLDGWLDYNRNGVWDANEQIFASRALVNGDNTLTFNSPAGNTPLSGETFARFRLSTTGGLGVGGAAANGEVEDYRVTLVNAGWQNPNNPLDVSGNGVVTAQDVLLLANFLYRNGNNLTVPTGPGTPPFPVAPPPYYDVNGDNRVDQTDAFAVINYLRSIQPAAPAPQMAMAAPPAAESAPAALAEVMAPATFVASAFDTAAPAPAATTPVLGVAAAFAEFGASPVSPLATADSLPAETATAQAWASSADELAALAAANDLADAADRSVLFDAEWAADGDESGEIVLAAFAAYGDGEEWAGPLSSRWADDAFEVLPRRKTKVC